MYHTIEEKLKALHEQPAPVEEAVVFGGFTMELPMDAPKRNVVYEDDSIKITVDEPKDGWS
jgi:hypothetical protein